MENIIFVKNLKRDFYLKKGIFKRKRQIVQVIKDVSFTVNKGEIYGLLGQNGAGKTTIIKILLSLLLPTSGDVRIMGYDVITESKYFSQKINFVFEGERGLYRRLTAKENLEYFSNLYYIDSKISKKRIERLLDIVGLKEYGSSKVETFSKGMIQRLLIAKSLVNDPEIIFMDEPTIGLDPVGAKDLKNIITNLRENKKTIFLTSHYLKEIDELCDRVSIIDKGITVVEGTTKELKKKTFNICETEILLESIEEDIIFYLRKNKSIKEVVVSLDFCNNVLLSIKHLDIPEILSYILFFIRDCKIISIYKKEPTLENAYIKILGEINEKY
ncbi:ABC transporter ATP-binding protein [Parvimonas parva]|uniref:ABC transporter ATP-binding protein n=1 Tax=Parvimonas parva TaxID=2769485 RepID=A0ABS1CAA2_9FIRM|nr:ABC transporter ATP-binding protein [Parvimonas parva]MBK1469049.1 ABC transporter ATP-binding protein [Parvimonas parva]